MIEHILSHKRNRIKPHFQPQLYDARNQLHRKNGKFSSVQSLSNMLLNNHCLKKKSKAKRKKFQNNEMKWK